MAKYELLSQRQYAKYLGVSNTLVSEAVKNKFIVKGFDKALKLIKKELADTEWGDGVRKIPKPVSIETLKTDGRPPTKQETTDINKLSLLKGGADLSEAVRVEKIAKANIALLEYSEKAGKLVDKAMVQKGLRDFGTQIRKAFENFPTRTVDSIRAAKDRNEALTIAEDGIREILEQLTTGIESSIK